VLKSWTKVETGSRSIVDTTMKPGLQTKDHRVQQKRKTDGKLQTAHMLQGD
jgi:hypothetical protein